MQSAGSADALVDLYADFATFYRYWSTRLGDDEIRFYERRALAVDGAVMELGVGTGRVAIPIARAGKEVIGVDTSPAMLAIARDEATKAGVDLTLIEADMRSFVADPSVDLAFIPNHSFQHMLTVEDQLATLRSVRASLRSGGLFIMSVFIPDPQRIVEMGGERYKAAEFVDDRGRRCELWSQQDYRIVAQQMDLVAAFVAYEGDDVAERTEVSMTLHMFVPREVEHLLARAEFEIESVYGWFDERPLDETSRETIWVARKP